MYVENRGETSWPEQIGDAVINIRPTPKTKLASIAIAVVFAGFMFLDYTLLRGDSVGSATVSLRSDDPARIEITQVDEVHLVAISTRRRQHNETKGIAIKYRLVDPDGTIVKESSELRSRKSRYFEFTPDIPGTYELFAEESMTLLGSGRGNATVRVYVNDRRVLGRIVGL